MKKAIQNTDAVTHKLGPASIKTTNHKIDITREK